jgi:hypothetical protein
MVRERDDKRSERRDLVDCKEELAGAHKPRNVAGLWKLEKTKNQIVPWSFQKGTQPCR